MNVKNMLKGHSFKFQEIKAGMPGIGLDRGVRNSWDIGKCGHETPLFSSQTKTAILPM
jgi:hypothetical protein